MDTQCATCCGPWWRWPLMLGLVLAAILIARSRDRSTSIHESPAVNSDSDQAPATGKVVSLAIDFGDGHVREFEPRAWQPGMTVYDLLLETPRENFRLEVHGSGSSAFLMELDGRANEGAGGRNWTYTVNGRHADRSFAIYELQPGDEVLWSFASQR